MQTSDASSVTPVPQRAKKPRKTATTYAKVDPAFFGVPLFRPLNNKNRQAAREKMHNIETEFDGRRMRIISPFTLGADDLSILLVTCSIGALLGKKLDASYSESHKAAIVDQLESEGYVIDLKHITFKTTAYRLVCEAGLSHGGDSYARVGESLLRLRGVYYADFGEIGRNSTFIRSYGKQNLLGFQVDEAEGDIRITLNARFASAILGGQFVRVNMVSARTLGETARILYVRLAVSIRINSKLRISIDNLVEWIYGQNDSVAERNKRNRRRIVRDSLKDIDALPGWTVHQETAQGMIEINRFSNETASPDRVELALDLA